MIDLKVNGKNEVMGPGNQNRNTAPCLPLGVLKNTAGEARDGRHCLAPHPLGRLGAISWTLLKQAGSKYEPIRTAAILLSTFVCEIISFSCLYSNRLLGIRCYLHFMAAPRRD